MTRNHFTVLGLQPGATDDDVKKAYRTLAKKYHPDKNKSATAEEQFKEVASAYEVLKSKDRREIYEREIKIQKEGFVRTEFKAPRREHNNKTKEDFSQRRRSEPPPRPQFSYDDEPYSGPYSQYRHSKGFKEKEFFDQARQKPKPAAGRHRPQPKPKWNSHWNDDDGDDMNFHDNGDKSSFSFAFKSFMDDMDISMSFTFDGDEEFSSFYGGGADPFTRLFGHGPGPQRQFVPPQHKHKGNVAGEHGYKGGLDEEYLFTPRTGMDSSESEEDSSEDSDFDYSGMRFTCAFCGKRLKLEDLKTHEPACAQRKKKNRNGGSDEEEEKRGYKKMFQEKTGDWRRDHERFQQYVKRAKRAYRINKSRQSNRVEALLCRVCGKIVERGEAQTHSLFCHPQDPHFGPPPTTNGEPPMKDSKFRRAKEYAKKKVPKFKKSHSADEQPEFTVPDPKTKGRDTMGEPMSSSGTGLNPSSPTNPTSPTSKFGKTRRAPAPPPPKACPGPTVGPAPTKSSPRSEDSPKTKAGRRASYPQGPQSNQVPGQRSSYPTGQQNDQPSGQRSSYPTGQQSQPGAVPSEEGPNPNSQISRQEDVGPKKVGSFQYVRTRYVIATKNPNISESESSGSDDETESDSDYEQQLVPRHAYVLQPRVLIRQRPSSGYHYPPNMGHGFPPHPADIRYGPPPHPSNIKIGHPTHPENIKIGKQPTNPKVSKSPQKQQNEQPPQNLQKQESPKKFFRIGKKK